MNLIRISTKHKSVHFIVPLRCAVGQHQSTILTQKKEMNIFFFSLFRLQILALIRSIHFFFSWFCKKRKWLIRRKIKTITLNKLLVTFRFRIRRDCWTNRTLKKKEKKETEKRKEENPENLNLYDSCLCFLMKNFSTSASIVQ